MVASMKPQVGMEHVLLSLEMSLVELLLVSDLPPRDGPDLWERSLGDDLEQRWRTFLGTRAKVAKSF